MYKVVMNNFTKKNIKKIPHKVNVKLYVLMKDLQYDGVIQNNWHNYSKLGENLYHCHLDHHYVAVWCERERKPEEPDKFDPNVEILITYVGSRGNAPY
jgi:hypothetical protein